MMKNNRINNANTIGMRSDTVMSLREPLGSTPRSRFSCRGCQANEER